MTKIHFYKKIDFLIEPGLKKKLKKYCIDHDTSITKVLIDYIKDLVKKNK